MSDEIARIPAAEISRYNPAADDWDSLIDGAHEILGYDLARDELADALVGVPGIVTRVSYRPGVLRPTGEKDEKGKPVLKMGAYVSCETVLAPEFNLTRINVARKASGMEPLVSLTLLPFDPSAHVVLNDGSTGIYRQITEYLAVTGYIKLKAPIVANGAMGESSYDSVPSDWEDISAGELRYNEDGFALYEANIRLRFPRGLRLSEYDNPINPNEQSKTRYFA